MGSYGAAIAAFALASVLGAALTPIAAAIAVRSGVVSEARSDRWGSRPTPLLGGAALLLALLVALAVLVDTNTTLIVILVGALGAFLLGLIDDVRGLRPTSKLAGQVALAGFLALGGIRAEWTPLPEIGFLVTLFWVVGMMNALNLVDNMDGLAAGIAAIAAGVLVLMAPVDPTWIRVLAAALAGSCVGFLIHNFAPARVYMGDAGSMMLGLILATLGLLLTAATNVGLTILGPLLVLGLPIFDIALVTVVRRAEGRPLSQGGRDHISHRLAARGLSERQAVLLLYGIGAGLAVLGLLLTSLGLAFLPLAALSVISLILFGVFLAEDRSRDHAPATPRGRILEAGRRLVRFGGEIGIDVVFATMSLFSAFLIRFDTLPIGAWLNVFLQAAPIVIPIQLVSFVVLGVYRTLWSYMSVTDLVSIARAAALGTLAAGLAMIYGLGLVAQSRAVLFIDAVFLAVLVSGSRLFLVWLRHWFALRPHEGDRRVIIVGASESGEIALRLLLSAAQSYHPAGFLDDDPGKHRRRIGGVPVLGSIAELAEVARRERIDLVILAVDDPAQRQRLRETYAHLDIEMREFPRPI